MAADARHDFVQTLNQLLSQVAIDDIKAILQDQIQSGQTALQRERMPIESMAVYHSADMQFRGQTHVLNVALPQAESSAIPAYKPYLKRLTLIDLRSSCPKIGTMLINLNTTVIGQRPAILPHWLIDPNACASDLASAQIGARPVWFSDGWHDTPIYQRTKLPLDSTWQGPAIVQQLDTTVVIEPSHDVQVDAQGNLTISVTSAWKTSDD